MLILTRKTGEKINIGDDIVIDVLEVKGRQVRIGIQAPSHVPVHREEVYRRIQEENLKASAVEVEDLKSVESILASLGGPPTR